MNKEEQYKKNKSAKVGETIVCPTCGTEFVKKQYSQAFCCGKCKDAYWTGDRRAERKPMSEFDKGWWNCFESFSIELGAISSDADKILVSVLHGAGVKAEEIEEVEAMKAASGDYVGSLFNNALENYKKLYC